VAVIGEYLIYLINHNKGQATVRLAARQPIARVKDLMSGAEMDAAVISLPPMAVRLMKVRLEDG